MLSDSTHLLFVFSIREHPNELKAYHELIVQARLDILSNSQKVSVLGEFVNIFHFWRGY